MKDNHDTSATRPDLTRRRVIGSAIGLGSAASLGILAGSAMADTQEAPKPEPKSRNYTESEHIRRYYQSARL